MTKILRFPFVFLALGPQPSSHDTSRLRQRYRSFLVISCIGKILAMITRSTSKFTKAGGINDGFTESKSVHLRVLRWVVALCSLFLFSRVWSLTSDTMARKISAILIAGGAASVLAAPPGFPASGNGLWYTEPGTIWSRHSLPIGNGFLGAMTPGGTQQEATQLNIESLWSGGPFADPVSYSMMICVPRLIFAVDLQWW